MGKRGHCKSMGLYFFSMEKGKYHQLGTGFFVHHRIVSSIKRVGFVNDRMSYTALRGHLCNIVVLMRLHQQRNKVVIQRQFL